MKVRFLIIAWMVSLLVVAGIYTAAEITYIPPDVTEDQAQEEEGPKEITVKAVNELMEPYKEDFLPRIAENGQTSLAVYAAPDRSRGSGPRIAILITSMGQKKSDSDFAIDSLPAEISMAFSPYAPDLLEWGEKARLKGHEVFVEAPMEAADSERADLGPYVLLTTASAKQNKDRLLTILSRMQGYVGVVNQFGEAYTVRTEAMQSFLEEVNNRGLMYVDKKSTTFTQGPAVAKSLDMIYALQDIRIDQALNRTEIAAQLRSLEEQAKRKGYALGIASNKRVTVREINEWQKTLARRGIQLVPVSSLGTRYQN